MNIYVSHSTSFDYRKDLYVPIQGSSLVVGHNFILPHRESNALFNTKELFAQKKCELVLAEVSVRSTGQGIELGWADMLGIPVICIYKKDAFISESLRKVSNTLIAYEDSKDMINKISEALRHE